MEKQNDSMRERLLASLPQPGNLAAYREETASLLAKHERALFWEKAPAVICYFIACVTVIVNWSWGQKMAGAPNSFVWLWAGYAVFVGAIQDLRYRIDRSKVDILKEVKQVQLQMLEVQASLQKHPSD
jgi:hypothetical protein